jgi:hypothetical protein
MTTLQELDVVLLQVFHKVLDEHIAPRDQHGKLGLYAMRV